jgi:hypothetical protein
MKRIPKEVLDSAMSYQEFFNMVHTMAEEEKTTGEQIEGHVLATKMNAHRMKRVQKMTILDEAMTTKLKNYGPNLKFLVIAESWCGDALQNIPVMAKMAHACNCVDIKVIMRDKHLDIMDQFLTNGSRSIPIMILLDENHNVLGKWGPRPEVIQVQVMKNKETQQLTKSEMNVKIQRWYSKDKGLSLQAEIIEMLETASGKVEH